MRLVLAAVVILAASGAVAVEDIDGSLAKLPQSDQRTVLDTLDRHLANGLSARLRSVKAIGGRRVCGLINPTDRAKIYIGFRSFLVELDSRQIYFDGQASGSKDDADVKALIRSACN